MNEKLLPIEEFALKKQDKDLFLALLQSVPNEDEDRGFMPTALFMKEIFNTNNKSLLQAFCEHFQNWNNLGYEMRREIFRDLCHVKNSKEIRSMLKNSMLYLEVPELQALFSLHDRESEDLYFKQWLPIILENRNFYDELDYLKESNRLDDLKARYLN